MKIRAAILLCLIAALLLSACAVPVEVRQTDMPDTTDTTQPDITEPPAPTDGEAEDAWPSYRLEVEPLTLSIDGMQDGLLEIKDTQGDLVLFALQEKLLDAQGMYAYYRTTRLGIYNTVEQAVSALWTLENEGWYYLGAFSGTDSAVFACINDYTAAYPSDFSLIAFDEKQTPLHSLDSQYPMLASMSDGTVLFSYVENGGSFGVCAIRDGAINDVLKWVSDGDSVRPLGGEMSVCGERFAYPCVQDGQAVLVTADLNGETERQTLEYGKEKLDSFSLTAQGLVASLSLNEDTDEAERALTFYRKTGEPVSKKRRAADGALYRIAFDNIFGVAVDSFFNAYILYATNGRVDCHKLSDSELGELAPLNGTAVGFYVADDVSFYFYYRETQQLYRVTLAPAA